MKAETVKADLIDSMILAGLRAGELYFEHEYGVELSEHSLDQLSLGRLRSIEASLQFEGWM